LLAALIGRLEIDRRELTLASSDMANCRNTAEFSLRRTGSTTILA
jgi:hypothetical protein